MHAFSRNYIITLLILLASFLILAYSESVRNLPVSEIEVKTFPKEVGEWEGQDIPVSPLTYEILETKNVLVRQYTNPQGEKLVLTIVHGLNNRAAFHPPELCYAGGGNELVAKTTEAIPISTSQSLKTAKLIFETPAGKETVWYWFIVGGTQTHNYYLQQLNLAWNELKRTGGSGAMIKVSTGLLPENQEAVKDFLTKVIPKLPQFFQR